MYEHETVARKELHVLDLVVRNVVQVAVLANLFLLLTMQLM
jgi:hypothetical protein